MIYDNIVILPNSNVRTYIYVCNTLRGRHQSLKLWYITGIPRFAVVKVTTVALYGLSGFNEITKCIINPLHDMRICLWVSFLGLKFNKFLGGYLRDGSLKTKY